MCFFVVVRQLLFNTTLRIASQLLSKSNKINKLEMMWKASVMVKFEAVCRNFPGKFEKNRESVIWARGFLNRYSNRGSSDCKSDTLSLEPSPSVRCGCRREQRMISTYAGSNTLIVIKEASRGIREGGTGPRILHISST